MENFILFNRDFALHNLIIERCENAGFTPNVVYESSQWDLIAELVAGELGVTMLPKSIYSRMNQKAISMIPPHAPPMWQLGIITKKDSYLSWRTEGTGTLSLLSYKWAKVPVPLYRIINERRVKKWSLKII
ncbi:DNA-binding transcriptional LysR family regulator [Bacillus mesophilus]|uniref:LysR substrate-binding domain-containing protein n=1 Tax=Bacillus mesophilus TaxID=1808955 RepID=A0A6M0QDA7_9BACI|nr:LysR substrate-binding domain-containing protein [Bacillus mesophilus]MBM7662790.1 DNA-binding transcriptional LysR family regulator [Bacillus mesophilus]NEY74255.1 hypothetical protein [Bacillus mesophilus]